MGTTSLGRSDHDAQGRDAQRDELQKGRIRRPRSPGGPAGRGGGRRTVLTGISDSGFKAGSCNGYAFRWSLTTIISIVLVRKKQSSPQIALLRSVGTNMFSHCLQQFY